MADNLADDPADDTRWLSYQQLGAARGISRASAVRLARKHKWRRQKNNAGVVTVAVPVAFTAPDPRNPRDDPSDHPADRPGDGGAVHRAMAVLEAAVAELTVTGIVLRAQLEQAQGRADRAEGELARVRAMGLLARLRAAWRG